MRARIRRPRSTRRTLLAIAGAALAVAVAGFLVVYFVLFPTSSPKPFKLAASATTTATATAKSATGAAASAGASSTPSSSVAGTWSVASGSEAGYRVREQLAFLPAQSDAVGRTSQISGSASVARSAGTVRVSAAAFTIAVNTLKSDRSMRDEKIHSIGLESDRYPTAMFTLLSPISLPASVLGGGVAHVSATGELQIHGTTRRVTVPLEVSISSSSLQAVGTLTFPWREFNMTAPSVGGFVTVTEKATMEFDLRLQRA
ncbi:MAG TPA: YceI family protein [Solirubrobacteraceae bacterium]|nr:YceI family protein [Solirubrobacteraceae bacterium]